MEEALTLSNLRRLPIYSSWYRPILLTRSNALVRSIKAYRVASVALSISSGASCRWARTTHTKTLLTMLRREMPQYMLELLRSTLFLYSVPVFMSCKSWETLLGLQQRHKSLCKCSSRASFLLLIISEGVPSLPLIALLSSSKAGLRFLGKEFLDCVKCSLDDWVFSVPEYRWKSCKLLVLVCDGLTCLGFQGCTLLWFACRLLDIFELASVVAGV